MEPLTRCANGHYYDAKKHSSCPFCGVQDLDIDIKKTMAKRMGGSSGQGQGEAGKTVGIFKKKLGMDPVVGWLVAIGGPERGRDFRIVSEKNFIGRSEKMDISLAGDESVSRENHAVVSYNPKNNAFRIYPGESRGLVYLNDDELVTPEELKANDIIELGQSRLMFVPFCGERFEWKQEKAEI